MLTLIKRMLQFVLHFFAPQKSRRPILAAPDLMGILEPLDPSDRIMLLPGTEDRYNKDKKLVARTSCPITFDNEADIRSCIEALRESDDELRRRPEALRMWEWDRTFREGMAIEFGVLWFDREFFERRKEAYRDPTHTAIFRKFGATPDNFTVEHEQLA